MRYNAFPPRAIGSIATSARGTGHVSQGMNRRFCIQCKTDEPTRGGFFVAGLFFCAKHERRKAGRG